MFYSLSITLFIDFDDVYAPVIDFKQEGKEILDIWASYKLDIF